MCVRVADDLRLFDLLCETSPRTVNELANTTNAEPGLIRRILRTLAGMGFVAQLDSESYGPTRISQQMVMRSVRAGVKFFHEESLPSVRHAPEYFKKNGYRLPRSMTDGP
jgi:DNA-binding IclR family transcriptional regulator